MSIQVLKVLLHNTAHENLIPRTNYYANPNGYCFFYLSLMPKKLRIKK